MSEHKHTPGPWHWNSDNDLWSEKNGEVIRASDDGKPYGMHMAEIEHHYDEAVKSANKNLIAAAPELLQGCEIALSYIEAVCFNTPNPKKQKNYADCAAILRAAIGKATGDTHE